jgi:hypothetical protein
MRYVRYAMLLFVIALIAPSAAAALAVGPRESAVRGVAGAPAAYSLGGIEFALQRGDNATPINPGTRFAFGPRTMWAFFSYSNANPGDKLKWVLRHRGTDVAWGEEVLDSRSGRIELEMERIDGDFLMLGTFTLTLDAQGRSSGDVRSASFEIYDPERGDGDNGNSNGNDNGDDDDNGNSNNNGNSNGNDNWNGNANDNS